MPRICHLFDDSFGWEQRVGAGQLLSKLPPKGHPCRVATIAPPTTPHLQALGQPVTRCYAPAGFGPAAAPLVERMLTRFKADLVHAWGLSAALAARSAAATGLIIELFDPQLSPDQIKLVRSLARPTGFAVSCSSQTVRRHLIEGGIAPEVCAVIRPGVDFATISRIRQGTLRDELGLNRDDYAVIIPEPVTAAGEPLEAYWAVELANHLQGPVRLIVPGEGREQQRILRLDAAGLGTRVAVAPGDRYRFEQLVAVADAFVSLPNSDASTTGIAWAMAAGAAVIATATYANAELLTNRLNGLLFKRKPHETPALPVARMLLQRDTYRNLTETARAQAFNVFGIQRYTEQHTQLYQNILTGAPANQNITDSAVAG